MAFEAIKKRTAHRDWLTGDRFMLFLVLAIAIHAVVLFGVRFGFELSGQTRLADTLDVVLVQWRSEEPPEEADYLAQADQVGGRDQAEATRPAAEMSARVPAPEQGDDAVDAEQAVPQVSLDTREIVARDQEPGQLRQPTETENPESEVPNAAELLQQSRQMARLEPEISRERSWQSKLPRREFISANTRKYEFAAYMSAWVSKVERVGNLNYPTELRRKKLHGDLVLTVGIHQNGAVESINVKRSSGVAEIDEAAVKIVRLAAPYAPLPDNIREHVDILHITRTWRFESALGVGGR